MEKEDNEVVVSQSLNNFIVVRVIKTTNVNSTRIAGTEKCLVGAGMSQRQC